MLLLYDGPKANEIGERRNSEAPFSRCRKMHVKLYNGHQQNAWRVGGNSHMEDGYQWCFPRQGCMKSLPHFKRQELQELFHQGGRVFTSSPGASKITRSLTHLANIGSTSPYPERVYPKRTEKKKKAYITAKTRTFRLPHT